MMIDEKYEEHIAKCWEWAEKIAVDKCGCSDNCVVIAIFNKMVTPLHFFQMDNRRL